MAARREAGTCKLRKWQKREGRVDVRTYGRVSSNGVLSKENERESGG